MKYIDNETTSNAVITNKTNLTTPSQLYMILQPHNTGITSTINAIKTQPQ